MLEPDDHGRQRVVSRYKKVVCHVCQAQASVLKANPPEQPLCRECTRAKEKHEHRERLRRRREAFPLGGDGMTPLRRRWENR